MGNLMEEHMVGGFTIERPPSEREKSILEAVEVQQGLELMSNASFTSVELISVKS